VERAALMCRIQRPLMNLLAAAVLAAGPAAAQGPAEAPVEAPAAAAKVPVVVLAAHPLERGNQVAAIWAARGVLERHPALQPVDLASRLGGGRPTDAEAVRALLEEGKVAYDSADVDEAEKDLSIAALIASGRPGQRELAIQALSTLARLRAARKDEKGAVRAFVRLLRLKPEYRLDPAQASPSAEGRLDAARAIIDRAKPARLRVVSEGVKAAVFVDGRLRGVTPFYMSDLPSGTHHLRIAADGRRDDLTLVDLDPGRETRLEVALLESAKAALFDQIVDALPDDVSTGDARDGLSDLKALAFAEQAVVLSAERTTLTGALFDLKAVRRIRVVQVPLDPGGMDAGRDLIRDLYRGLSPREPGLVAAAPEPEADEGVRWWLWGSVAAGVAAAVAIPAVIIALDDDEVGVPRESGTGGVVIRF